jgi:hypothetical protein
VITDNGDEAVLSQEPRRRQKQIPQIVQLVVDGNPQGLKRTRRRMSRLMLAAGRPQGTGHDRGQLSRGRDRLTLPVLHDVPRDPPRRPILSILKDQVCQRFFVKFLIISAAVTSSASILMSNGISAENSAQFHDRKGQSTGRSARKVHF